MGDADSIAAAGKASELLEHDSRVVQFYDPNQLSGLAIAERLGATVGKVAWDIYLFFDQEAEWGERAPAPIDWVHQLLGSGWADSARLHRGDQLGRKLRVTMEGLLREAGAITGLAGE